MPRDRSDGCHYCARMQSLSALRERLHRIDGRGYKAYKDIRGTYATAELELEVVHVQGDPFAAPSLVAVLVPHAVAGFGPWYYEGERRVAFADWILRRVDRACRRLERVGGSGKSGMIGVDSPGQEVLERTACRVRPDGIEVRLSVGLPAAGRRVLGRAAATLLCDQLPQLVRDACRPDDKAALRRHICAVEDQRALRAQLDEAGLVAFLADGACLPRRSGVDDRPMAEGAVPLCAPDELAVTFEAPHAGPLRGLGIRRGISLIVGGGFHGKSTLLAAIERGIDDHIPDDGRDLCVSDPRLFAIRAEDGRRVEGVDISPFIDNLPGGRDTTHFRSDDASGSTSQAASVIEALEAGARALLIDEDTAATNFMFRDARMQALIAKDREPITPFVDRVRDLYRDRQVSTVLVIGGSGDYFDVADQVLALHDYEVEDVTPRAKAIAAETGLRDRPSQPFPQPPPRAPQRGCIDASRGKRDAKIGSFDLHTIELGRERIDVSAVRGLVATGQLRAIGRALHWIGQRLDGKAHVADLLDAVEAAIRDKGLDALDDRRRGDLVAFRRLELAAALNRLRSLSVRSSQ